MNKSGFTRREWMVGATTAAGGVALPLKLAAQSATSQDEPPETGDPADRARRMKWWHDARFGMLIHWGLYSVLGRHEWVMENEGIPVREYEPLAKQFRPKPHAPRDWAALAKVAGQKYMVMTTKHHEGFCNFATQTTDYCAPKQGPGRDLVEEYVEAARNEGLRIGFYYSLMDWHHPDGARCKYDEGARRRFVDYIHAHIRELMTNYGKIDVLWYDVSWPLDRAGWESEKMNKMVFDLQPDIIVNNRNKLAGDFSTPEQHITASKEGRAWESCMTLNDSWGYQAADDNWKSPQAVLRNLITCCRDTGNYLLNIGPKPDGSVPDESVRILHEVGQWMNRNGDSVRQSELCQVRRHNYASFTRKGNVLYMHVHFWPDDGAVVFSGLQPQVRSAKLYSSGQPVKFEQDKFRVRLIGLPRQAPDHPLTTFAIECDSEPIQDSIFVRENKPREQVNVTLS